MVSIEGSSSFRNGKEIIKQKSHNEYQAITSLLNSPAIDINLESDAGQRSLSNPIQQAFVEQNWEKEVPVKAISSLKYDLFRNKIPIEIELSHKRVVYADLFKFLADFSEKEIEAGVFIVAEDPMDFGNSWHNNRASTMKKVQAIEDNYFVPLWVIGISP